MIFSDIFKYYLICVERATEDEITDICNHIDNIKIHNLLKSNKNLIDRFRFVVLVYDKETPLNDISINVFLNERTGVYFIYINFNVL